MTLVKTWRSHSRRTYNAYVKFESYRKKNAREIHIAVQELVAIDLVLLLIHKLTDGLTNLLAVRRVLKTMKIEVGRFQQDL